MTSSRDMNCSLNTLVRHYAKWPWSTRDSNMNKHQFSQVFRSIPPGYSRDRSSIILSQIELFFLSWLKAEAYHESSFMFHPSHFMIVCFPIFMTRNIWQTTLRRVIWYDSYQMSHTTWVTWLIQYDKYYIGDIRLEKAMHQRIEQIFALLKMQ